MPDVVQHTLYQVSTATALVEGIYQGAVRVATLREHGDLGLGTFENLDGEMVIVDGHFGPAGSCADRRRNIEIGTQLPRQIRKLCSSCTPGYI